MNLEEEDLVFFRKSADHSSHCEDAACDVYIYIYMGTHQSHCLAFPAFPRCLHQCSEHQIDQLRVPRTSLWMEKTGRNTKQKERKKEKTKASQIITDDDVEWT